MEERRDALNEAERGHLDDLLDAARALARARGLHVDDGELPTPAQMDRCLEAWAAEPIATRVHANDVVHALGASLGAHLCARLGLHWIVVVDEVGTDLAVNGEPNDILLFPIDATAKRLDRGEVRFFEAFLAEVTDQVERIRQG